VVDSVGGNHFPFARAFIDALNDNKDVVDMSSMYPLIRRSVLMSTEQSPVYSDIRKPGMKVVLLIVSSDMEGTDQQMCAAGRFLLLRPTSARQFHPL